MDLRECVVNLMQAPRSNVLNRAAMRSGHRLHFGMRQDGGGASAICGGVFRSAAVVLVFILSVIGLNGCLILSPFDRPAVLLDSGQFMETWKTYRHCRSSVDPQAIIIDLLHLNQVAQLVSSRSRASVNDIPSAVRTLITMLPSRMSVDPHAMAAACALHGGSVAQAAGRPGLSVALLTAVVAGQRKSANPYYAGAAHQRLRDMEWKRRPVETQVAELAGEMLPR